MHDVAMARKPRTTMTAMAQCGKLESLAPDWTLPLPLTLLELPLPDSDADEAVDVLVYEDDDLVDEVDDDVEDVEDSVARTESAYVV